MRGSTPFVGSGFSRLSIRRSASTKPYPEEPYRFEQTLSPAVAMLVANKGIKNAHTVIKGSGPKGRILKSDVLAFLNGEQPPLAALAQQIRPASAVPKQAQTTPAPKQAQPLVPPKGGKYEDLPNSNVRKIIASRLTESKSTIPHHFLSADCQLDNLLHVRKVLNESEGVKLSVNDFIVRAIALALRDVPEANASWAGESIRRYNSVDVSVAVATDKGLLTPIIKNAHQKGLGTIAKEIRELASRAREGKLKPEEFQGGTVSVSNLGMFGISEFSAVINPPQGAILAVGEGRKVILPSSPSSAPAHFDNADDIVLDEETLPTSPKVATVVSVTLSCDNRAIEADVAGRLLHTFQSYVENPELMA
jgi:pyruvate dehydrogenase E2 component (dihydrolipoamide acetyltransferase)